MFVEDFVDLLRPLSRLPRSESVDSYGAITESYGSPQTFSGYIEVKKSSQGQQEGLISSALEYSLICDSSQTMALRDRIVDGGKTFTVENIEKRYDGPTLHHLEITLSTAR